jgi:hypothetical protein
MMNKKVWESLNKVEEYFTDLQGIRQHLNLVVNNDSSAVEMEEAIYFVVRLLERYEEDLTKSLATVWEVCREESKDPEPNNKLNNTEEYSQLINSKIL